MNTAAIRDVVLMQTPENIHFTKGAKFDWVYFERERCTGFTAAELDAVEAGFRAKYTRVYLREVDIPREHVSDERYHGGFKIQYRLQRAGPRRITLESSDWEGMRASASGSRTYEWNGARWDCVEEGVWVIS